MLKRRRYILAAVVVLLLALLGVLLYQALRGIGAAPDANGAYFVMQEGQPHGKNAVQ